jgi:hypothetical protein
MRPSPGACARYDPGARRIEAPFNIPDIALPKIADGERHLAARMEIRLVQSTT